MTPSTSNCLDCSQKLYGRSDKKFCNDHCRNSYHAKRNKDWNNYMRNINHILRKNRRILAFFHQNNVQTITTSMLALQGFQISYCTSFHEKSQERYYYDYQLIPIQKDKFKIVYADSSALLQTG